MNKLEKENYCIWNLLVGKSKPTVADDTLTPIVFVRLCTTQHTHPKIKTLKCLLDSGSSATLVKKKHVKLLHLSKSNPTMWKTSAGTFKTTKKVEVKMTLPELHSRRVITHKMYVCPKLSSNNRRKSRYSFRLGLNNVGGLPNTSEPHHKHEKL